MSISLDSLHPVVGSLAKELLRRSSNTGIPIVVTQTLRTPEEQDYLYSLGRTRPGKVVTNARGGYSYHNYGLAFDIALLNGSHYCYDTKISVNDIEIPDFLEVGNLGEFLGLEWGGKWKFVDIPHFQYTFGLKIKDLRAGKRPPTGTA